MAVSSSTSRRASRMTRYDSPPSSSLQALPGSPPAERATGMKSASRTDLALFSLSAIQLCRPAQKGICSSSSSALSAEVGLSGSLAAVASAQDLDGLGHDLVRRAVASVVPLVDARSTGLRVGSQPALDVHLAALAEVLVAHLGQVAEGAHPHPQRRRVGVGHLPLRRPGARPGAGAGRRLSRGGDASWAGAGLFGAGGRLLCPISDLSVHAVEIRRTELPLHSARPATCGAWSTT